jgi:Rieske 2Fe-2S family protein
MATFKPSHEGYVPGQLTLPQKYYVSEEIWNRENEKIFNKYWICVGHVSRIPGAGDYYLFDVLDEKLIIVRTKKGEVKALFNVCRHRGTLVCDSIPEDQQKPVDEETGHTNSFQCPYHAWTYDLEGNLISATKFMKGVPGFKLQDHPMGSLPVHVWQGFIFVNFGKNPEPFEKQYKGLIGRFDKWQMGRARSFKRITYSIETNWKYVFQNFNECYHCPTQHPLLNSRIDYTGSLNDLTEGPVLGGYFDILGDSMTTSGKFSAIPLADLGDDLNRAYYYTVFGAGLLLNIHGDYVMFHLVVPVAPGKTIVISEWLFNPEAWSLPGFNPEDAVEFWDITNLQDWHLTRIAQQGVRSRDYKPGWYSPRESLLESFDRFYLEELK